MVFDESIGLCVICDVYVMYVIVIVRMCVISEREYSKIPTPVSPNPKIL